MKFIQINLHHSKAAAALLCHKLALGKADIALIQEPWVQGGQIRGLSGTGGTIFLVTYGATLRSCIYVRNHINVLPLLEYCSSDMATVWILYSSGGNQRELIVTSAAYIPQDLDEPPPMKELRDVVDYFSSRKKQLVIECDVNAHHILWGSNDINPREESLVEHLPSSNLYILNQGNEPTFVVSNRMEVFNFTLGTNWIGNLVINWQVSDEPALSDYRYILFQIGNVENTKITFRDPKKTGWKSYVEDLTVNLGSIPRYLHSVQDVELAIDWVQQSILSSYYCHCPVRVSHSARGVLKSKQGGSLIGLKCLGNWVLIRNPLPSTIGRLGKPKGPHGRGNARGIEDVPGSARLMKIMVKQANNRVSSVKLPDGCYMESGRETLLELCRIHFPDFRLTDGLTDGQGQSDLDYRYF
jgi:hypothetical protein